MDTYTNALFKIIATYARRHYTCVICKDIVIHALLFGQTSYYSSYHFPCMMGGGTGVREVTDDELVSKWVAAIFNVRKLDVVASTMKEYITLEDLKWAPLVGELSRLRALSRSGSLNPDHMRYATRIIRDHPNLSVDELFEIFRDIQVSGGRACDVYTEARVVNNGKVHPVWNEWFMNTHDYDNMVQWMPREMMEDVVMMTRRRSMPETVN